MYERLRLKLVKFFEWRGCVCPEDLADKTIDRVTRKLGDGERLREEDPAAYFYGVARNILREYWNEQGKERTGLRSLTSEREPADQGLERERRHQCLERCLAKLPPESRELLLLYYQGQTGGKIQNRKALAARLGVPLNALRIRTHRLRAKLEECARGCMNGAVSGETDSASGPQRKWGA